jgi:hypothetical protein
MLKGFLFIPLLIAISHAVISQTKTLNTIKTASAPRIDGILDDECWKSAAVANDFVTFAPVYGQTPVNRTEVRVLYDNSAIYIAAHLYDDPGNIRKQMTPRDQERQADTDHFAVFLDTYKDRQNAFQFLVTSRNVQTDARISPNVETGGGIYGDLTWDAVWDSRTVMVSDGWTVEIRIPHFSIRFSKNNTKGWGIQFLRFSRRLNETSVWEPVDPNISGFVNQFGDLTGVEHLVPPLRLSFSPYVSGGYRVTPSISSGTKTEDLKSGGMDVKLGISESFTLDATLIPDFGQVVSDNIVNNISPFEIQFRENRPFFTEGTELFNKADIFYSRRVGDVPGGYDYIADSVGDGPLTNYSIIKNPAVTRLYNAIKFSGRTQNNLGIGIFNAVARPERALLRNRITGEDSLITTEVLTNYNVFVLDQALKNRSYITLTNTNVLRNGSDRDANVTGLDIALYDKTNTYGFFLRPRYSKVFEQGNNHDGFKNDLEFGKVSGVLQFAIRNEIKSPRYDPNDLGFLLSPNEVLNDAEVSYNIFKPSKSFLNQQYEFGVEHSYLYKPFEYQKTEFRFSSFWLFRNFFDLRLQTLIAPFWYNDFFELQTPMNKLETPRRKLKRSPYYSFFADGSSDSRKRLFGYWSVGFAEGPLPDDPYYKLELGLRYRFSDKFSLEASYARQYDNGQFGYAFLRDGTTDEPILARRKFTDVTSIISGIYNFRPRMTLTFRARHFWNRLNNTNLYDVKDDGYWTERLDLLAEDQDVNYNAFNLDVFYTWDFKPGSRIIFSWKNSLGSDYENYINGFIYNKYTDNVRRIFATPHTNEISLRFIYFLDYQQLRKK